jgi:hypothetical protein
MFLYSYKFFNFIMASSANIYNRNKNKITDIVLPDNNINIRNGLLQTTDNAVKVTTGTQEFIVDSEDGLKTNYKAEFDDGMQSTTLTLEGSDQSPAISSLTILKNGMNVKGLCTFQPNTNTLNTTIIDASAGEITCANLKIGNTYIDNKYAPISGSSNYESKFSSQTSKTFLAAPNASNGVPSFRTIEKSDIPALDYAPKFDINVYEKNFFASPNASTGLPVFRRIQASDIPALNYAPISGSANYAPASGSSNYAPAFNYLVNAKTFFAGPKENQALPLFRTILASDLPALDYAPTSGSTNYAPNQELQLTDSSFNDGNVVIGSNKIENVTFTCAYTISESNFLQLSITPTMIFYKNFTAIKISPGNSLAVNIVGDLIYYFHSYGATSQQIYLSEHINGPKRLFTPTTISVTATFTCENYSRPIFRNITGSDFGKEIDHHTILGGNNNSTPSFRKITALDFASQESNPNTILGPNADGDITIRKIVPSDFEVDTSSQLNKVFGGNSGTTGPTFRNITGSDFGSITVVSTSPLYLGVTNQNSTPTWRQIDASTTSVSNALAGVAVLTFGATPNFPAQTTNTIFGSHPTSSTSAPIFRNVTPLDFGNQNTNKVLAGPTSSADAKPTFRQLVPFDLSNVTIPSAITDVGGATSSQFLGLKYYSKTKFTFVNTMTLENTNNTITVTGPTTNPIISASDKFEIGTGISFGTTVGNITKDVIYFVKTFTSTTASTTITYTMSISDTKNGPTKSVGTATITGNIITIRSSPYISRTITGVTAASAYSGVIPPEGEEPIFEMASESSTQVPNTVLAGPPNSTDGNMEPTYRALVSADIPDLSAIYAPKSNSPNYVSSSNSQSGNTVLAGPNGGSGAPSFRSLVPADIPALDYAPISGSPNYISATTPITANWILASGNLVNDTPFFRPMVFNDLPMNGNQSLTTDVNQTIDASLHIYTAWTSGASATARTFNIINLTFGRRVFLYLRNTNGGAKTISFTASATSTTGSAVNCSNVGGSGGGASVTSVTLAASSGTATIQIFNAGGVFGGSIG